MKNTSPIILFHTSNNFYFYDLKLKRIHLCNPVFYRVLQAEVGIINSKNPEKLPEISKKDSRYYRSKILLLRKAGYFQGIDIENVLSHNIKSFEIEASLANLRQITFEICDYCNLKCHYCGYGELYNDYDKRETKNLDINIAKNLVHYLRSFWDSPRNNSHNYLISIGFYGGEPLLNFSFIREMVHFIKSLDTSRNLFSFSITTNGVLLYKYMDFLVDHNFNILISLDGDEKCNAYRVYKKNGKPAFHEIFDNVVLLQKRYPEYFNRKVNFNAVFHNKSSISKVYSFFKENFDKIPSIANVSPYGILPSKQDIFLKTYSDINQSLYSSNECEKLEKEMFINLPTVKSIAFFVQRYVGYIYNNYNSLLYPELCNNRFPTGTCFPFEKKLFLTVNGKILPCERISHQYALGYADSKNVKIDFEKVAQIYNIYFDKMRKRCNNCLHFDSCQLCIFNFDLEGEILNCKEFMDYEKFTRYLSTHMEYIENYPEIYSKIIREVTIE